MSKSALTILTVGTFLTIAVWPIVTLSRTDPAHPNKSLPPSKTEQFTGSTACSPCHQKFHKLWSQSHHGLAMQPFTSKFAQQQILPLSEPIQIGEHRYTVKLTDQKHLVIDTQKNQTNEYPIAHVMGGKNVYYFLTPMDRGRLQVLPVAFDVRRKQWFDATKSMIRHFTDRTDEPIDFKHPALTFNTSCYNCHVSQLSTNYDLDTDTYQTKWAEPGINCETCHGPASEHIRVSTDAPKGTTPENLMIIVTSTFDTQQTNAMCAPCHAKMRPLTTTFKPGDRYFDHYDLTTLEHPDFYPDGRDLGENYTYTLWKMSPCVTSGMLDCVQCHTPSGRYKFKADKPNNACMPCHKQLIQNTTAHTNHPIDSPANNCISCHMPTTEFARMKRTDHSMRPPVPAASVAFESPNACNICHSDKDAVWADKWVRKWYKNDYQKPILKIAHLIDQARKANFSRLPEMLSYITSKDRNEIYAASLIRLLSPCHDNSKWPIIRKAANDESPLIRSAAIHALLLDNSEQTFDCLINAASDDYRLVRLQAAYALSFYPQQLLNEQDYPTISRALNEYEASLKSRPDDSFSHFNLGNYYSNQHRLKEAIKEYAISSNLLPDNILPLVNTSLIHAQLGDIESAEKSLRQALQIDPASLEANYNLGLLLAESGDTRQAQAYLKRAHNSDPNIPEIAYNLAILIAPDRPDQTIELCRSAYTLRPNEPKYAYSLAYYLLKAKKPTEATEVLTQAVEKALPDSSIYILLGQIYELQGKFENAITVYEQALANKQLPPEQKTFFSARLKTIPKPAL